LCVQLIDFLGVSIVEFVCAAIVCAAIVCTDIGYCQCLMPYRYKSDSCCCGMPLSYHYFVLYQIWRIMTRLLN